MRTPPQIFPTASFTIDKGVAIQDVINVQGVDQSGFDTGNVRGALDHLQVYIRHHDQSLFARIAGFQHLDDCLGFKSLEIDLFHDQEIVVLHLAGQRGFHCQPLYLLVKGVAVITRLRA